MQTFKCLRDFWYEGNRFMQAGDTIELTDGEALELCGMPNTVEPTSESKQAVGETQAGANGNA